MDIQGLVTYKLFFYISNVRSLVSTLYTILALNAKGVKIGKGLKFFGCPIVVRHPKSQIVILDNCRFRSEPKSNLIGINKKCIISTHSQSAKINIGSGCGFSGTSIGCMTEITIGNDVLFGANTLVTDFDWHNVDPGRRKLPVEKGKKILIEDNVFIGYGAIILKGVCIGQNSVIGANSVVTTNIPPNCVAAGNPCKVISYFNEKS